MGVEFPQAQLHGYLTEVQVRVEPTATPMPFPPTPENPEVSEPTPLIEPNSYKDIKDSLYFQERMVKTKKTKKLTKKEKEELQAGKQPRQPIQATPLCKTGIGNKAAQNEVDNTIKRWAEGSTQECSSDWGCEETPQVQTRDCSSSWDPPVSEVHRVAVQEAPCGSSDQRDCTGL